jgi:hypothetical protein
MRTSEGRLEGKCVDFFALCTRGLAVRGSCGCLKIWMMVTIDIPQHTSGDIPRNPDASNASTPLRINHVAAVCRRMCGPSSRVLPASVATLFHELPRSALQLPPTQQRSPGFSSRLTPSLPRVCVTILAADQQAPTPNSNSVGALAAWREASRLRSLPAARPINTARE